MLATKRREPGGGERESFGTSIDVRREVYLIFKEAVNNVARHSGCTRVEIVITLGDDYLSVYIEDDGRGFVNNSSRERNGLEHA